MLATLPMGFMTQAKSNIVTVDLDNKTITINWDFTTANGMTNMEYTGLFRTRTIHAFEQETTYISWTIEDDGKWQPMQDIGQS